MKVFPLVAVGLAALAAIVCVGLQYDVSMSGDSRVKVVMPKVVVPENAVPPLKASGSQASVLNLSPGSPAEDVHRRAIGLWSMDAASLRLAYSHGMESKDERERYLALQAGQYCTSTLTAIHPEIDFGNKGDEWKEAQEAKRLLKDRCVKFYGITSQDLFRSLKELRASIDTPDSSVSGKNLELGRDVDEPEEIQRIKRNLAATLANDGVASLLWASGGLQSWLEFASSSKDYSSGMDPVFHEGATIGDAMILALCKAGYSCGKDSLVYLNNCSDGMGCGKSVDEFILSTLDEKSKGIALAQAEVIASSVASGRLKKLGLQ